MAEGEESAGGSGEGGLKRHFLYPRVSDTLACHGHITPLGLGGGGVVGGK